MAAEFPKCDPKNETEQLVWCARWLAEAYRKQAFTAEYFDLAEKLEDTADRLEKSNG